MNLAIKVLLWTLAGVLFTVFIQMIFSTFIAGEVSEEGGCVTDDCEGYLDELEVVKSEDMISADDMAPLSNPEEKGDFDKNLCEDAGGDWESCGSYCRGEDADVCVQLCAQYCECLDDNQCPVGFSCEDVIDGVGICLTS